jgi:hypothetical protein
MQHFIPLSALLHCLRRSCLLLRTITATDWSEHSFEALPK